VEQSAGNNRRNQELIVQIHGNSFRSEGASLGKMVGFFTHFNTIFGFCMPETFPSKNVGPKAPGLAITSLRTGSLEVSLTVDVSQLFDSEFLRGSFGLFKDVLETIGVIYAYFKLKGKPIKIELNNQRKVELPPKNEDGILYMSEADYELIKKSLEPAAGLIEQVDGKELAVARVEMGQEKRIDLDQTLVENLTPPEDYLDETDFEEIEGEILSLHKETGKGILLTKINGVERRKDFEIVKPNKEIYIEAFSRTGQTMFFQVKRELAINALGEEKIRKFRLYGLMSRIR
jgi:hypothetical protein